MKQTLFTGIIVLLLMFFIGFTGTGNYSVINKSGVNVTSITISPIGDNTGNSVSFSRSIGMDQSISIDFTTNTEVCEFDVRFTDDQGREYVMTGIDLCNSSKIILVSNKVDEVPQIFVPTSK